MTYDLAKQLKDVGFPQGKSHLSWCRAEHHPDANVFEHCLSAEEDDRFVKIPDTVSFIKLCDSPTLEELIEACRKFGLKVELGMNPIWPHMYPYKEHMGSCLASAYDEKRGFWGPKLIENALGGTPSEAVANLWIELNKK